ncbi:MAG: cysteine hydrolase [Acidobacteriota bacterium]|nr:cysteine hydrolase [Acidobacteriota bacterium]
MAEAFGFTVPTRLEELIDPQQTALMIYDMQVGIVSQIDEGQPVQERCVALLAAAREARYRIVFTRHMWLPLRGAGVGQLRRAMIWHRTEDAVKINPPFLPGSTAWQVAPQLNPLPDEVLIDKITMSAFEGTFLDIALRDAQIKSFIVAGIALEVGIVPTVLQGSDLNYVPIVVTDACGSKTAEAKERALRTLADTGEVIFATTERIAALMTSSKRK